jgi:hypothetical protein
MAKKVAAKETIAAPRQKPSAVVDTRLIYCGDNVNAELTSHPMVRGLFELATPLIVDESRTNTLTSADLYSLDVFDSVSHLIQSFELLERSRRLAILMPSEKYLKGLNINRYEWLEYHISTFLVAFAKVGDEALLLVNEVQCLGVDPKDCRARIV